jgi:RHS repeat-associated protein
MDIDTVDSYSYDTAVSPSPLVNPTFVLGELASATSPKGSIAFSYDPFGRINARTFTDNQGGVYVNRSEQHADGSLSSVTFNLPDDSYASEMVKYGYDSAGRLRTIQFSDATGKQDIYSAQSIDDYARPTAATYGGTTSYQATYENGGRRLIRQLAVKSPEGSRQILFGQFDPLNRELYRQELTSDATSARTASLTYDALGRLATSSQTNGTSSLFNWKFDYDALGNIRMLSNTTRNISAILIYDTTDKDRLCHVGYADTIFGGWLDGLVTGSLSPYVPCNVKYDETGNIVTEATRTGPRQLSYFLSGNVRTITQKDKKASFAYGPLDQLQTLDVQTSANSNRHEEHYGALIERHDVVSAGGAASFITRNIPGPNGVLASRRGFTTDWIYGFGELRGNRFSTNKDGSFVQNIDYQPFGESKSTGVAPDTPDYTSYQWNGGEELAEFGVSHLGARVYDPVIGRFLSRDPLLIPRTASSSNPYAFAANDPWNGADPSGLDSFGGEYEELPTADIDALIEGQGVSGSHKGGTKASTTKTPSAVFQIPADPESCGPICDQHWTPSFTLGPIPRPFEPVQGPFLGFLAPQADDSPQALWAKIWFMGFTTVLEPEVLLEEVPLIFGAEDITETAAVEGISVSGEIEAVGETAEVGEDVLIGSGSRSAFRRDVLAKINGDDHSLLKFLVDERTGKFITISNRAHSELINNPLIWEAGHAVSDKLGGTDLMIQSAWENQVQNLTIERFKGLGVVGARAVDISGVAVSRSTALWWEELEKLPAGTVENAPEIVW